MKIFVIIVSSFLYGLIVTLLKTFLGIRLGAIPTMLLLLATIALANALYKAWGNHKAKKDVLNNEEEQSESNGTIEENKTTKCADCQAPSQPKPEGSFVGEEPQPVNKPCIAFCRKCGAKLIENGNFCNKCGTKIT